MSILDRLFTGRTPFSGPAIVAERQAALPNPYRDWYRTLRAFYEGNGVYDALTRAAFADVSPDTVRGLRNPVNRAVEAVAAHLWPGALPDALPVEAENDLLAPAVADLFKWSNWAVRKQVFARELAIYGDVFLRVAQSDDTGRPYLQTLRPDVVTAFAADRRGFLTFVRTDVMQSVREVTGLVQWHWETEAWDKETETLRIWRHTYTPDTPLAELGPPDETIAFATYGIDFVPFVRASYRDTGDTRGASVFSHAIEKIIEADRAATRLHQMLYRHNKPLWVVNSNTVDKANRPIAAPHFADADGNVTGTLQTSDDTVLYLPGMADLKSLVPPVDYAASLAVLDAHLQEIERDIPELAFYRVREFGSQLSGYAVRLLLSDAVARIEEARGNAESALISAVQMAITIGQSRGFFADLGSFDSGDLAFHFAVRPIIGVSNLDEAQRVNLIADILSPEQKLRELGYSEEDIVRIMKEKAAAAPPPPVLVPPGTVQPPGAQGQQGAA